MWVNYTPNGYIVPAKFGVHFLPLTKSVQKRTNLHLNEIGLTKTEFCKSQSQLRQSLGKFAICRLFALRE